MVRRRLRRPESVVTRARLSAGQIAACRSVCERGNPYGQPGARAASHRRSQAVARDAVGTRRAAVSRRTVVRLQARDPAGTGAGACVGAAHAGCRHVRRRMTAQRAASSGRARRRPVLDQRGRT